MISRRVFLVHVIVVVRVKEHVHRVTGDDMAVFRDGHDHPGVAQLGVHENRTVDFGVGVTGVEVVEADESPDLGALGLNFPSGSNSATPCRRK